MNHQKTRNHLDLLKTTYKDLRIEVKDSPCLVFPSGMGLLWNVFGGGETAELEFDYYLSCEFIYAGSNIKLHNFIDYCPGGHYRDTRGVAVESKARQLKKGQPPVDDWCYWIGDAEQLYALAWNSLEEVPLDGSLADLIQWIDDTFYTQVHNN